MEIFLIRHTTVEIEPGICYGHSEVPCGPYFEKEVEMVINKLPDNLEARTFSSPLSRCVNLAKKISNDYKVDERLKELNFGRWELKKWDSLQTDEYFKKWTENYVDASCPEGESYWQLEERCIQFLKDKIEEKHNKIIVVTHAGCLRALLSKMADISLESSFNFEFDCGSVSKFEYKSGIYKVIYLNQ